MTETANRIVAILPTDAAETLNSWIQSRATAATNDLAPKNADASRPKTEDDQSIAIPSPPPKKAESNSGGSSGSPMDKQKLDALINKNAPFAPAPKQ